MSKATGVMSERRRGNGMSEVTSVMSEGLTAWDLRNNVGDFEGGQQLSAPTTSRQGQLVRGD